MKPNLLRKSVSLLKAAVKELGILIVVILMFWLSPIIFSPLNALFLYLIHKYPALFTYLSERDYGFGIDKLQRVWLAICTFVTESFAIWVIMWLFWKYQWDILKNLKKEDLCKPETKLSLGIYFALLYLLVLTLSAV